MNLRTLLITLFLFTTTLSAQEMTVQAVEQVSDRFIAAWNKHDACALSLDFDEDAQFVNYIGMWWQNKNEIALGHDRVLKSFLRLSELRKIKLTVKIVDEKTALSWLVWELTGQLNPNTGEVLPPRQGILSFVLRNSEAGPKIIAAQNTDIIPLVQTTAPDGSRIK